MPSETEQGKVQAKIRLITNESGSEQIQLIIPQSQYEKFQEYKNIGKNGKVIDQEFYAGLTLENGYLYITGSFNLQTKVEEDVHLSISSVGTQSNEQPTANLQEMKEKLSLNGKSEVEVNISKHFIKELKDNADQLQDQLDTAKKELQTKTQELKAAKEEAEQEKTTLEAQLAQANTNLENAKKEAENKQQELQTQIQELEAAKQQKDEYIATLQDANELAKKLKKKDNQIEELSVQVDQLKQKTQVLEATNAEVKKLNTELEAQKSQVQQLQKRNKELEAQKQPTEQSKQSKAPTYTAVVGVGLATGLAAFTALDRTVRLDMWIMVGIALASALAVGGITYFALKPSTQVSETQEPQNANVKDCCKA
ncbi:hypothetical protein [Wolbachia pipientis]|uniref:hypothetical protein n=1 Tax=Wolbachia pipientis TaxID=955 RepID=UPI002030631D|nr:hypothetical protein [Wolbachia pipientis]MCM1001676.1 hypothetical protein [Wolbachia pipientis]